MNSPIRMSNTRRNLFGIRLNHEQLNQDLTTVWKDQIDRQKKSWNFDFETLKPLTNDDLELLNSQSPIRNIKRFEWCPATVKKNPVSRSYNFNSDNEEDDEALAVPQFYQHQRVKKMMKESEDFNRLKQVRLNTIAKVKQEATTKTTVTSKKPAATKKTTKKSDKPVPSLIITFSENRKDTLRSALSKKAKKTRTSTGSGSDDGMKQQKISCMLKQRKRKVNSNSANKKTE